MPAFGGQTGWARPTIDQLIHLFESDLGAGVNTSVLDTSGDTPKQIAHLRLFSNVQLSAYWSSTDDPYWFGVQGSDGSETLAFATFRASHGYRPKFFEQFPLAMHPGDVAATVDEPAALGLAGLALAPALGTRRRWAPAR